MISAVNVAEDGRAMKALVVMKYQYVTAEDIPVTSVGVSSGIPHWVWGKREPKGF